MLSRIGLRVVVLGLLATGLAATSAVAAPAVNGEFPVSGLDSNNKLTQGPDGNIWVTLDDGTDDVARITPGGEVKEFDLGAIATPQGITTGPDDFLWITHDDGVTKFAAADPEITKETTSIPQITGNHSIVAGPDLNLWVAADNNLIRIPPGSPGSNEPFEMLGLAPSDIDVAGSLLAIADFGGSKVTTATTTDPPVTVDYPIAGGPQGVAGNPSSQIAFSQPTVEPREVGLLFPPGPPLTTQFPGTDPYGVALGPDDAYWFAESDGDRLIRLTADNKATTLRGFAAASFPRQIAAGPGNTLWVTLQAANKVARVSGVVPESEPVCFCGLSRSLRTRIVKGPKRKVKISGRRALVRFRFRSPDKGVKFECALTKIRKGAVPRRRFRDCKPPQIYALRPGKYRFWVRAVRGEEFDRTPAKRTFFVIRKR